MGILDDKRDEKAATAAAAEEAAAAEAAAAGVDDAPVRGAGELREPATRCSCGYVAPNSEALQAHVEAWASHPDAGDHVAA